MASGKKFGYMNSSVRPGFQKVRITQVQDTYLILIDCRVIRLERWRLVNLLFRPMFHAKEPADARCAPKVVNNEVIEGILDKYVCLKCYWHL